MNLSPVPFPPRMLSEAVWLRVTLSGRFSPEQVRQWQQRLQAYLSARELVAAISPRRMAIVRPGGAIGPSDRGMVVGWLIAQPEVVLVHVERRSLAQRLGEVSQEMSHV